jgi:hypothetical protein
MDFELGTPLHMAISIFHEQRKGEGQLLGTATFEVSAMLGAKGNTKAKLIPKNGGVIYARVDKFESSGTFTFKLSGSNLKNVEGMFSKSDPFYEISRKDAGEKGMEWNIVYRSNHIMNNLNPAWNEDTMELSDLCLGDLDTPLLISVFDFEKSGKHVPMGKAETTVNGLLVAQNRDGLVLIDKGKEAGKIIVHKAIVSSLLSHKDKNLGPAVLASQNVPVIGHPSGPPVIVGEVVAVPSTRSTSTYEPLRPLPVPSSPAPSPSFIDYVTGGCEISLIVAIDFTGSNGDPRVPGTLHYHAVGIKNDYEKAILAVGNILSKFDSDQKFPVW